MKNRESKSRDHATSPEICNIVATITFNVRIDLKRFARIAHGAYRPKRFAAVSVRIRNPKSTAMVFNSGKCVCIGTTSKWQAQSALNRCFRIVALLYPEARISNFAVQNIVSFSNLGARVDLHRLSSDQPLHTVYNPELFPGLRWTLYDPHTRASVFYQGDWAVIFCIFVFEKFIDRSRRTRRTRSGNVIITGCSGVEEMRACWDHLYKRIAPYLRHRTALREHEEEETKQSEDAAPDNRARDRRKERRAIDLTHREVSVGRVSGSHLVMFMPTTPFRRSRAGYRHAAGGSIAVSRRGYAIVITCRIEREIVSRVSRMSRSERTATT
eukprot:gene475-860_t